MVVLQQKETHYFDTKEQAAYELLETLPRYLYDNENLVSIGVSEGGVFFSDYLSTKLGCVMDILLTEPISAPQNPELTLAMISETEEVVIHKALADAFKVSEDFIYAEAKRKYDDEVLGYAYKYRQGKELVTLEGRDVLLVDECIESGLTMMVALKSVIELGARNIYIATPIVDAFVYENLVKVCDEIFTPHKIRDYISIEYYYKNFEPLGYEEILEILQTHQIVNKHQGKE
jgi:putative phosphoribosyl transferase